MSDDQLTGNRDFTPNGILDKALNYPENHCKKKYDDRDLIDPVHHSQIEIGFFIWIWLFENIKEVIADFT
jgi:hypothetical protein